MNTSSIDTIVLGGGVVGTSIAYFLARRGQRVALVERGVVGGGGATRFSGGIVRGYDPDPFLGELSALGSAMLASWDSMGMPGRTPLRKTGFVYLAAPEGADDALARAARLTSRTYPIRPAAKSELRTLCPFVREGHPGVAMYEENGGYGDPRQTSSNLSEGVRRAGGIVFENCDVRGLVEGRGGHWDVQLAYGAISAPIVVVAAGAFSARFVPDLPIFTRTIPLAQMEREGMAVELPVVDEWSGTYLRPTDGGGFFAGSQKSTVVVDPSFVKPYGATELGDSLERVVRLMGPGADLRALNGIQGFDGYTTDLRPIVGFVDDRPGLYVAAGMSGRGYKYCLALGHAVAREIAPGERDSLGPCFDISPFKPRYAAVASEASEGRAS